MEPATPDPPGPWAPILGKWRTDGFVVGDVDTRIVGTDTYQLLPGGHFVIHHVDVCVGDTSVRAVELIGEPGHAGGYLARSYDSTGATELMALHMRQDGSWRFEGGPAVGHVAQTRGEIQQAGGTRSTVTFSSDGTRMRALWERSDDGQTWVAWMDVSFTKQSST